jgi:pyruvate dehydrogenase E2 component (dihydrolipoamide acetyltransferase)
MNVKLPKLSATMEEATIVEWVKREGESVREGDVLYIVETDKTSMEVESPISGVLTKIHVEAGKAVPVETDVCTVTTAGSVVNPAAAIDPPMKEQRRLLASPSARRRANELQVQLEAIQGSGPHGRIRNVDVEQAANQRKPAVAAASPINPPPVIDASSYASSAQPSKMRQIIANELVRSVQTIPSFWVEKWVDAERILESKNLLKQTQGILSEITVTDFLLQALGQALIKHPHVNSLWSSTSQLLQLKDTHVGMAVGMKEGILVPVLQSAGSSSLLEIIKWRKRVLQSIRDQRFVPENIRTSITLSNLGSTGIDRFQAIIRPDESMILAVGTIKAIPVVKDNQVVVRQGMVLTLSSDHRIIDGMAASTFLGEIATWLEHGMWTIAE